MTRLFLDPLMIIIDLYSLRTMKFIVFTLIFYLNLNLIRCNVIGFVETFTEIKNYKVKEAQTDNKIIKS